MKRTEEINLLVKTFAKENRLKKLEVCEALRAIVQKQQGKCEYRFVRTMTDEQFLELTQKFNQIK